MGNQFRGGALVVLWFVRGLLLGRERRQRSKRAQNSHRLESSRCTSQTTLTDMYRGTRVPDRKAVNSLNQVNAMVEAVILHTTRPNRNL